MSLMTGTSVDTFVQYGGVTGTATAAQIEMALQVAWNQAEEFIGTQLYPHTITEEVHMWPHNDRLMLNKTDVTGIATVTARHDDATCTCSVTDITGCAILIDPECGVVKVDECYGTARCGGCRCSGSGAGGVGRWIIVTYTAGLAQPLEDNLLLALVMIAKNVLAVMTGGLDEFGELQHIDSWRSMDYSQKHGAKKEANPFSYPSRAEMARELLSKYKRNCALGFANPRKSSL